MAKEDTIRQFPAKRISAFDGMAITAKVWTDAHEYHRRSQQIQALLGHGPGILTGLEVLASDPADSSVYISPGIARDPAGQIIVVAEPVRYDLGRSEGRLFVLLSYGEGRPLADGGEEGGPTYIHAAFAVEAKAEVAAADSVIELARIQRRGSGSAIADAKDPEHPGDNELDLRFRREAGAAGADAASIAVVHLGKGAVERHARGASNLARAMRHAGQHVWVDGSVGLGKGLEGYALVYVTAQATFKLSADEMNTLYTCVQGGGTLFIESCRHDASGAPPADAAFADLLGSLGIRMGPLPQDHSLLAEPNLFAAPPAGFETEGKPGVTLAEGVIYSTSDYGCLWQGEGRDRVPTREEIRAALEWGANLVAYAQARRKQHSK